MKSVLLSKKRKKNMINWFLLKTSSDNSMTRYSNSIYLYSIENDFNLRLQKEFVLKMLFFFNDFQYFIMKNNSFDAQRWLTISLFCVIIESVANHWNDKKFKILRLRTSKSSKRIFEHFFFQYNVNHFSVFFVSTILIWQKHLVDMIFSNDMFCFVI